MREMKDSGVEWIGEIPVDWEILKGKYCYSVQAGYPFDSKKFSLERGFPLIRIRDITSGYTETFYDGDYDEAYVVHSGDCIIGMDGDFNIRVWNNDNALLNQRCCRIKTNEKTVVQWVFYNLPFELKVINDLAYSTTVKHLSNEDILNAYVIIPKLNEQNILVDYLNQKCSQIDSIISKQEAIIEKLKEYKLSIITEAVTKGLDPNVEMKDSGYDYIGCIPNSWSVLRVRNIGKLQNGISKGGEFFGYGFPFVSYGDVYKNYSLPSKVSGLLASSEKEQENYSVKKGDIFFTRTSETIDEVGFSCVCEQSIPNATFAGFIIRLRPLTNIMSTCFAKYYFRSSHNREYLSKQMNLVTRASLGQELLKSMPVLLPPESEQKTISAFLDKKCRLIDDRIMIAYELMEKAKAYKKSLIYETVTGKHEVESL